jgi:hypothetical protein
MIPHHQKPNAKSAACKEIEGPGEKIGHLHSETDKIEFAHKILVTLLLCVKKSTFCT